MGKYFKSVEVIFHISGKAKNMADTRNFSSDFCLMAIINKPLELGHTKSSKKKEQESNEVHENFSL